MSLQLSAAGMEEPLLSREVTRDLGLACQSWKGSPTGYGSKQQGGGDPSTAALLSCPRCRWTEPRTPSN